MEFIVAVDNENGIGKNGDILFRVPEDMRFFKRTTVGSIVVMGRKTYESLPKRRPLVDRENIILSKSLKSPIEGFSIYDKVDDMIKYCLSVDKKTFIIGGGQIYPIFKDYYTGGYVTKFYKTFDADVFFPDILSEYNLGEVLDNGSYENVNYEIKKYEKNSISWKKI